MSPKRTQNKSKAKAKNDDPLAVLPDSKVAIVEALKANEPIVVDPSKIGTLSKDANQGRLIPPEISSFKQGVPNRTKMVSAGCYALEILGGGLIVTNSMGVVYLGGTHHLEERDDGCYEIAK